MPAINSLDFITQWHITEKCNLNCLHCYQTASNCDEMSFEEIKKTITEISCMISSWKLLYGIEFTKNITLTGGEPILRKNFFKILSEFSNNGFNISVLTNGTLIDKQIARSLYSSGLEGVQVSIEGPENIHNRIRGEDSFSASIKGVKQLLDAGLEVTLNSTLSQINADHLPEMISLASDLNVHRLGFSRLVPCGRGRAMSDQMLDPKSLKNLYKKVFSASPSNTPEIVTGDPVALQFRDNTGCDHSGEVPVGGCAAGISGLTIMPDGTVLPCRRLPVPIGNVRKDPLREIWSASEVLNDLRDKNKYKGKCGQCDKWANCRGCRAIAYAYSIINGRGDILAPDPQCFI